MKIIDVFDVKRFWKVLRIELMDNIKIKLLALVLLGLMIPVFSLLTPTQYSRNSDLNSAGERIITDFQASVNFNPIIEVMILCIGGLLIAVTALNKPLNAKHSVLTIYLLPASTFEKFLSIFLVRIMGYAILSAAIVFAGSLIAKWENQVFLHRTVTTIHPDEIKKMWLSISTLFAVLQSIYFFCGLLFRKNALIKTTGLIIGFMIGGSFFCERLGIVNNMTRFGFLTDWAQYLATEQVLTVSILFLVGLPLFFWTLSYIRLTETEGR